MNAIRGIEMFISKTRWQEMWSIGFQPKSDSVEETKPLGQSLGVVHWLASALWSQALPLDTELITFFNHLFFEKCWASPCEVNSHLLFLHEFLQHCLLNWFHVFGYYLVLWMNPAREEKLLILNTFTCFLRNVEHPPVRSIPISPIPTQVPSALQHEFLYVLGYYLVVLWMNPAREEKPLIFWQGLSYFPWWYAINEVGNGLHFNWGIWHNRWLLL